MCLNRSYALSGYALGKFAEIELVLSYLAYSKDLKSNFYTCSYSPLTRRPPMHILQPKHVKLKSEEVAALLSKYNISISQLPKVKQSDSGVPQGCVVGDILKIERKEEAGVRVYFRIVA